MSSIPVDGGLAVSGDLERHSAPALLRHPWFEGVPQTIFGHSWPAADGHNTPRGRSIDLVRGRLSLGPVMNHARGGQNSVGITGFVLGNQHHAWTPGLKGIVWMHVGGNDMIQADMTIQANRDQLRREVESALAYLVAGQVVDSAAMTATGTWTNFTPVWPGGAIGGTYRYSTSDNATDRLDATITGNPTKYAVHYIVTDDVGLPARDFTIHPNAGSSVATIQSGVFPTAANWPGNNGVGHSVYLNTHGSALTSMRMQNTTTEQGGSGTPAYVSIDGVSIPNLDTPPLVMVLADPRVVDYASATERANVKTEIDTAVSNVNTWMGLSMPCIYVVDLDDGWPTDNSLVGSDHLHPTDAGCRFIADHMEQALLDWTRGKLTGQGGTAPTEVPWKSTTSDAATLSHVQGSVNGQYYPIDRPRPATADFTTSGTAEQIIHTFEIPACSVEPGDSYRISLKGYKTGTSGTLTCRLRVGTLNTISDALLCASVATASITANTHAGQEIEMTIRSIGVGGSIIGDMDGFAGTVVWPGAVGASVPVTLDTQPSPFYMHVTMQVSVGTYVKTSCSLEKKLGAQRIGF